MPADDVPVGKRPIRPPGAPPRPGAVPDDETIVRPRPIQLPRRVIRDEPLVAERLKPSTLSPDPAPVVDASVRPVTAPIRTVVAAAAPLPSVAQATVLTHRTIGRSAGQLDLADARWSGSAPASVLLEARSDALPELDDDVPPRRLIRQPAFIAAVAAAVVVVAVVVVLVLMQTVFRGPDRVESLQVLDGGDDYVLQWSGPDVPYDVVMTKTTSGKNADVSQLIKGGRQAWIPKSYAGVTDSSCFVVRSQRASESQKLPTTKAALAAQGAARVCVSSVTSK